MIFELARDFQDAVAAMPAGHPKHRMLKLLEEALRRDIHFIDRHATTLFQCMWNSCWWYDCPEAAEHYVGGKPPSLQVQNAGCSKTDESSAPTLSSLLQRWRDTKEGDFPGFQWVVALRPPALHLGAGYKAVFTGSGRPCFSPDGSLIAVTCGASVRVFDIDSGAEVVVLRGHQANVTSVCFSHDGCRVVTGSLDKTVRVWDLCGAQEQTVFACACDVKSVAYSPDGSQIAAASGPVVHLWNAHTGHESAILKGQRGRIWNISYSPNGSWIAAGDDSDEGVARIWDTRIGAEVGTLEVGAININTRGRVLCVRFSPDGRFIATGSFDRMIRLYDSETHIEVSVLEGHLGIVFDVCFSPDGRRIASASEDETVRLWDVPRGEEIDMKPRAGGQVRGVTFSPVGSLLATSSSGLVSGSGKAISANKVRVWDASIDQKMVSLRGHNRVYSDPRTVTYSPDGSLIATKSWSDRTLRVWDAASGIELAVCHDAEGGCDGRPAVWSPDSSQIAFKTLEDNMRIWDVFRNRKLVEVSSLQYGSEILNYSADGDRIIVRDGFSTIRVYDLRKTLWTRFRNVLFGRELLRLDGHNDHVRCLSLAPDGSRIVTCSEDGKVRLWDARTTPWARLRYLLRNRNLVRHPASFFRYSSGNTRRASLLLKVQSIVALRRFRSRAQVAA